MTQETQTEIALMMLPNGTELIGEVFITEGGLSIKNPCVIQLVDQGGKFNKATMRFVKYAIFAKENTIMVTNYNWIAKPIEEIEENYKRQFSPIITPDKKIIV